MPEEKATTAKTTKADKADKADEAEGGDITYEDHGDYVLEIDNRGAARSAASFRRRSRTSPSIRPPTTSDQSGWRSRRPQPRTRAATPSRSPGRFPRSRRTRAQTPSQRPSPSPPKAREEVSLADEENVQPLLSEQDVETGEPVRAREGTPPHAPRRNLSQNPTQQPEQKTTEE